MNGQAKAPHRHNIAIGKVPIVERPVQLIEKYELSNQREAARTRGPAAATEARDQQPRKSFDFNALQGIG